jgi:predicted enzyme related to lactoylglutathione lyase
MTTMTQLAGKFVWFELVTTDRARAEAFYGEVLGWKTAPMTMGDEVYTLIVNGAAPVGGVTATEGKAASHWISYVSVPDVDAAVKRVAAAGGQAEAAFDVPTVGRMAKITDPQGAALYLFRGEQGDEAKPQGTGAFYWNELWTSDPGAAVRFYEGVVGYRHEDMDMGPGGTYHMLAHGEQKYGGVMKAQGGAPTMWLPYVAVDDCDAAAARAKRNGATIVAEPSDIPGIGRFAIFKDPTGAVLAIIKSSQA